MQLREHAIMEVALFGTFTSILHSNLQMETLISKNPEENPFFRVLKLSNSKQMKIVSPNKRF